jgi:hypothetical protein
MGSQTVQKSPQTPRSPGGRTDLRLTLLQQPESRSPDGYSADRARPLAGAFRRATRGVRVSRAGPGPRGALKPDAVPPTTIPMSAKPKRKRYTAELVEAELRAFTAGRDTRTWPTWTEFEQAGLKGLRKAVDRLGGTRHWMPVLGIERLARPTPGPPPWTLQRITGELDALVGSFGCWPTARQWTAMGHQRLLAAMRAHGGVRHWAREYGFEANGGRWLDDDIEAELRTLLAGRSAWPSKREFEQAGKAALREVIKHHPLRPAGWADRLKVSYPAPRARCAASGKFMRTATATPPTRLRGARPSARTPRLPRALPPA